jgi:deoxyribose-phosphate aldolase
MKLLPHVKLVTACKTVEASGADFVKTSTGFNGAGATVENVHLIQNTLGSETLIKASGKINTLKQVQNMLDAGANRIGTSSGIIIMNEIPIT